MQFAHQFEDKRDKEVVAFLSALLSYGNVKTILGSIEKTLAMLGPSPYVSLKTRSLKIVGFRHRFTTEEDLRVIFSWLASALERHDSLQDYFGGSGTLKEKLSTFVSSLRSFPLDNELRALAQRRSRNLKYLLSSPEQGSACKRLNMFLRWVVRPEDEIDLGLWDKVAPHELILPLDTHLLKTVQYLGWTKSKQATWRAAEEATRQLRRFDEKDPIRFDFSLCHLSMQKLHIKNFLEKEGA